MLARVRNEIGKVAAVLVCCFYSVFVSICLSSVCVCVEALRT